MDKSIDLGNLIIPIIKPIKGVDYFTVEEVQQMINEVFNRVNPTVEQAETARQNNETTRQNNEISRQNNENIRQQNEEAREIIKERVETLIEEIQRKLDNGEFIGEQGVGITNISFSENYTIIIHLSDGTVYESGSIRGEQGERGEKGDTPERGVDYWTGEDKREIIQDVENDINIPDLQERLQDAEKNQLTGQASGQSIDLSDSADSRVRSIELEGNSEQESTTGKNLFDKEAAAIRSGTEKIVLDTGVRVKQTVDGQFKYLAIKIGGSELLGKQVTFGGKITPSASNVGCVYLYYGNQNNATVTPGNVSVIGSGDKSATITLLDEFPANCDTVWLLLYSNRDGTGNINDYIDYTDFMFVIGSALGEYEPYTGGIASPNPSYPQEIHSTGDSGSVNEKVQNKNLAKIEDFTETALGNATIAVEEGIIKINGTTSTSYAFPTFQANSGSAVFSIEVTGYTDKDTGNSSILLQQSNDGQNWSNLFDISLKSNLSKQSTGTLDSSKYYRVRLYNSNNTFSNATIKVQLEYGTVKTNFVAYEEQNITIPCQQPMRAIGEYKDTFVKVDGNWYERHYIGQKIFDGTETTFSYTTSYQGFRYKLEDANLNSSNPQNNLMCSHFKVSNIRGINGSPEPPIIRTYYGTTELDAKYIFICDGNTDVNVFKTWLSNNNVELIYVLATPVDLPCTEEQTEALESLEKARTYKPVTHISSEDTVPATIDLTYVKDLETVINNLGGA